MNADSYDVVVNDQLRRVHLTGAERAQPGSPDFAEPRPRRSGGLLVLDCSLIALLVLLPCCWSLPYLFATLLSVITGILLGAYGKIIWRLLELIGPPDEPHVIAIIKAPDIFYCPCCGRGRTDAYCTACGTDVRKEYRRLMRRLARYVVEETDGTRASIAAALRSQLQQTVQCHKALIEERLSSLERNYVMEIAHQRKQIAHLQNRLVDQGSPKTARH